VCDADLVECRATQGEDVERLVVEKVSGALVALQLAGDGALGPVRHSATIGVDQAAEKRSRMVVDDLLLPIKVSAQKIERQCTSRLPVVMWY